VPQPGRESDEGEPSHEPSEDRAGRGNLHVVLAHGIPGLVTAIPLRVEQPGTESEPGNPTLTHEASIGSFMARATDLSLRPPQPRILAPLPDTGNKRHYSNQTDQDREEDEDLPQPDGKPEKDESQDRQPEDRCPRGDLHPVLLTGIAGLRDASSPPPPVEPGPVEDLAGRQLTLRRKRVEAHACECSPGPNRPLSRPIACGPNSHDQEGVNRWRTR
jgi:hypothetical protein